MLIHVDNNNFVTTAEDFWISLILLKCTSIVLLFSSLSIETPRLSSEHALLEQFRLSLPYLLIPRCSSVVFFDVRNAWNIV